MHSPRNLTVAEGWNGAETVNGFGLKHEGVGSISQLVVLDERSIKMQQRYPRLAAQEPFIPPSSALLNSSFSFLKNMSCVGIVAGLQKLEGLDTLTKLRCLYLQQNLITQIENVQCLVSLRAMPRGGTAFKVAVGGSDSPPLLRSA